MSPHSCFRPAQELSHSNRSGISLAVDQLLKMDALVTSPHARDLPADPSYAWLLTDREFQGPVINHSKRKHLSPGQDPSPKRHRQHFRSAPTCEAPVSCCLEPFEQHVPCSGDVMESQESELLDRVVAALILAQKDQQQRQHQHQHQPLCTTTTTSDVRYSNVNTSDVRYSDVNTRQHPSSVVQCLQRELVTEKQKAAILTERLHQSGADLALTYEALTRAMAEVDALRQEAEFQLMAEPLNAHTSEDRHSCCEEGSGDNFVEAAVAGRECDSNGRAKEEAKRKECLSSPSSSMPLCKGCSGAEATVLLMPCRHLVLCGDCSRVGEDCPVCHRGILSTINVNVD